MASRDMKLGPVKCSPHFEVVVLLLNVFNCRHIDHNEISNITEFTDDQFDGALTLYSYKLTLHDPFANIPYLEKL